MSISLTQATIQELNSQYLESQETISSLKAKLKQGLEELMLLPADLAFALDFVEDHVTLFRFLKDCEFDETLAYGRIIDTVLWRKEKQLDLLTYETIHPNFYDKKTEAFAFFHGQDRFSRPIAVIRMRHFPNFGDLTISDTIPPFACLVMEIARKWTRDLTRQNEALRQQQLVKDDNMIVLVSQIVVIIDISKSPMIPLEKRLIQELRIVTDDRFPGFFGSIYVMNFGWMYQGLWQMVKLMLTERAKSKVNFPSANEVKQYISEDNLLIELGGTDDYVWTLENDEILQQYGKGWELKLPESAPPPPPPPLPTTEEISCNTRPSRSLSTSSFSSDDFYDAPEAPESPLERRYEVQNKPIWGMPSGYSSVYGTPGTLTPIGIRSPSQWRSTSTQALLPTSSMSSNQYFRLNGIHLPSFLTSFFGTSATTTSSAVYTHTIDNTHNGSSQGICGVDLTYRLTNIALEQHQQQTYYGDNDNDHDNEMRVDNTNGLDGMEAVVLIEKQINQQQRRREPHFPHLLPADDPQSAYASAPLKMQLRRSEQRLVRVTRRLFRLSFAYNGTLYWVLLYIFLRGPVEHSMKRLLAKMMMNPRTITYTTVGLTASVAAGLSASLSSSLGR